MRIPGPKWGAGRPPLETPKSRCAIRIGRTPRRLRGWSFGAVGESASAYALATIAAPPPLRGGGWRPLAPHVSRWGTFAGHAHLGASPPGPPRSPLGDVCRSCAPIGGCAPWPPAFPVGGRLPVMRAYWGLRPLAPHVPRWGTFAGHARSAWDNVRCGFCGNAFANLPEAPAAKRLGVPSLPSRGCAEGTLARPPAGESQRGRSPLWPVFAYFLLARK